MLDPLEGMWKDVICMAILETEWVMRGHFKTDGMTLWEEMFARHQREQEELLKLEGRTIKRSGSLETVKNVVVSSAISKKKPSSRTLVASKSSKLAASPSGKTSRHRVSPSTIGVFPRMPR